MVRYTIFIIFLAIDLFCYNLAKYPERSKLRYKLPGGGIVALIVCGRKEKKDEQSNLN